MLNRYTTTRTASRISWLHCVVSRKNSLMSLSTNSRRATGSQPSSDPTVQRQIPPRMNRSAPSCALVKPCAYSARWSSAPIVTNAAAVLHKRSRGSGSSSPCRKPMTACDAHSLGKNGDVGPRSRMTKSSRLRNPSGRASCSGRISRKSKITPPAAPSAMMDKRSRVRRAGKTFTRINVTAEPSRNDQHREYREDRVGREQHAALEHHAVGREDRDDHERDHP